MSSRPQARRLLSEALALPDSEIPEDVRIGSIDQWDSLAHARILLAIEEVLGTQLSAADAASIESLDAIEALLSRSGKA